MVGGCTDGGTHRLRTAGYVVCRAAHGRPRIALRECITGHDEPSCAMICFLSTLPTAVLGSVGSAASMSGLVWADTPRASRKLFSSARVIGLPENTTAAQIFS